MCSPTAHYTLLQPPSTFHRLLFAVALQTRATFPAFGGFLCIWRSKRAQLLSHLEGYSLRNAPNARNLSRIWRVLTGVTLQTCATFPAFGGFLCIWRSKRAQLSPHLERASVLRSVQKICTQTNMEMYENEACIKA